MYAAAIATGRTGAVPPGDTTKVSVSVVKVIEGDLATVGTVEVCTMASDSNEVSVDLVAASTVPHVRGVPVEPPVGAVAKFNRVTDRTGVRSVRGAVSVGSVSAAASRGDNGV